MGTFFRTVVCRNRKLQFSADKGENDCSCLFEACPETDTCLAESGCRRYSADRLQLFLVYVSENLTEVYTNADSPYEIKVPAGSRTNIVLPDGTEVSLNAGSVLRYHRGFGIRERNVTLDGERIL